MELRTLKQSLGIDVSKDSLSLSVCTLQSDLRKEFITGSDVSNDAKGYKALEKWLCNIVEDTSQIVVLMEATGVYHERIAMYLHTKGYFVSVMQSGRVKKYAQSLDQRSKTDALDSKMLSMLGIERELQEWIPPRLSLQELRGLSRERFTLIQERSIARNRIHALNKSVHENTRTLQRFEARLRLLNAQIAEIEQEMAACVEGDEILVKKLKYLESIPGVSFISAATVVAETSGFTMIENAKQLTSYAGYDVVLGESGNYRGKTRISKKGNKYIRAVLHMPSMAVIRVNPTLQVFYNRLKPHKAKPIVALVAVQRKMLVLMYSLWKNEMYYDAEYEQKKAAKKQVLAAQDRNKPKFVTS